MNIEKRPREQNDFYKTPPHVTSGLLSVERFTGPVWEPACGDGAISQVLLNAGVAVVSTDLIDRGYGEPGRDFLAEKTLVASEILTNPPYKSAEAFVQHALHLGAEKIAMLLRLSWLEGEGRRQRVFSKHPPARVWVLSARPTLWDGTDPDARSSGGAMSYAWFVWDKSSVEPTRLGWIPKRPEFDRLFG